MKFSLTITKYIAGAVLPYFVFAWLLLSVILFVQQAGRFSDIFFGANVPPVLVWQLAAALIPSVIAFTCPMAVLAGVVIGLSKMQGDSELVAVRAAGVGTWQIILPLALIGILLSAFAFLVNIFGVPAAATIVRGVALKAAIYKLESPIEPGVFNTEVAGFTIYVNKGDLASGEWRQIFIHAEDPNSRSVRLITSSSGRIDSSDEVAELVLENARSIQLDPGEAKVVSENIGELRFAVKTRRGELISRMSETEVTPEELGLIELARYVGQREGKERVEAQILWQRRVLLSITPFIFSILGAVLVLRFSRGGKGFGAVLSLVSLLGFYVFAFLGEQLARTGRISVLLSTGLPIGASILAVLWFLYGRRLSGGAEMLGSIPRLFSSLKSRREKLDRTNYFVDLTSGLRDFDISVDLVRYYIATIVFLSSIFLIFTAFELWRFAGSKEGGVFLLASYLAYLLPFVYLQIAPSAAMVAILVTYVIKSRRNEIVTWTAAGQSIYRLLVPAFVLTLILGIANWQVEERLASAANVVQEEIRTSLRSSGSRSAGSQGNWSSTENRIIRYSEYRTASDNDGDMFKLGCTDSCLLSDVSIYEFDDRDRELQQLYRIPQAAWEAGRMTVIESGFRYDVTGSDLITSDVPAGVAIDVGDLSVRFRKKPNQLTIAQLHTRVEKSVSELEQRIFAVALEKKYVTIILPFVVALFTAPFALSLNRKGKAVTVGYAVGLWLVFMGFNSVFEQFGISGALEPRIAVWTPIIVFSSVGLYLLSRTKT